MRVVFDIDGTLADCRHRLPLILESRPKRWNEFHALCSEDKPIQHGIMTLQALLRDAHRIIFMTGRPQSSQHATTTWLLKNIPDLREYYEMHSQRFPTIYMRTDGDRRPDYKIKLEWCEIEDPSLIFEDRTQVVEALRKAGYNVYQVRQGDY